MVFINFAELKMVVPEARYKKIFPAKDFMLHRIIETDTVKKNEKEKQSDI